MRNLLVRFRWMLGVTVLLALVACGDGEDRAYNVSTNPAIEAQAAELFAAMQSGDDVQIVAQYHDGFFAKRSEQEWLGSMKRMMAERGPMRAHHLRRSQADTRFSGKFYILEYETVHTGQKRLHHTVTFLLSVNGGPIQLNGHKMTPWETDVVEESAGAGGEGSSEKIVDDKNMMQK